MSDPLLPLYFALAGAAVGFAAARLLGWKGFRRAFLLLICLGAGWLTAWIRYDFLPAVLYKQLKYGAPLRLFADAVQDFAHQKGRMPRGLEELVAAGLLPAKGPVYCSPLAGSAACEERPFQKTDYELAFATDTVTIGHPRALFYSDRHLLLPESFQRLRVGLPGPAPQSPAREPQQSAVERRVPDAFNTSLPCEKRVPVHEALARAVGDKDPLVRWGAVEALARASCGTALTAHRAALTAVADPDARVRAAALNDLAWMWRLSGAGSEVGAEARGQFAALRGALRDSEPRVRVAAANALRSMGARIYYGFGEEDVAPLGERPGPEVVPSLLEALKDRDADVRAAAAEALGYWRAEAKTSVAALAAALDDAAPGVREQAAGALGRLAPEARMAVPRLIARLADDVEEVQFEAADALKALRDREGVDAVRKYRRARAAR